MTLPFTTRGGRGDREQARASATLPFQRKRPRASSPFMPCA